MSSEDRTSNPTINQAERACRIVIEALALIGVTNFSTCEDLLANMQEFTAEEMLHAFVDMSAKRGAV